MRVHTQNSLNLPFKTLEDSVQIVLFQLGVWLRDDRSCYATSVGDQDTISASVTTAASSSNDLMVEEEVSEMMMTEDYTDCNIQLWWRSSKYMWSTYEYIPLFQCNQLVILFTSTEDYIDCNIQLWSRKLPSTFLCSIAISWLYPLLSWGEGRGGKGGDSERE